MLTTCGDISNAAVMAKVKRVTTLRIWIVGNGSRRGCGGHTLLWIFGGEDTGGHRSQEYSSTLPTIFSLSRQHKTMLA